jgi:hypothetical protein
MAGGKWLKKKGSIFCHWIMKSQHSGDRTGLQQDAMECGHKTLTHDYCLSGDRRESQEKRGKLPVFSEKKSLTKVRAMVMLSSFLQIPFWR